MKGLIEALQIFAKYTDVEHPTSCSHDELCVLVDPSLVSGADIERLAELGFKPRPSESCFYSFRFGSA